MPLQQPIAQPSLRVNPGTMSIARHAREIECYMWMKPRYPTCLGLHCHQREGPKFQLPVNSPGHGQICSVHKPISIDLSASGGIPPRRPGIRLQRPVQEKITSALPHELLHPLWNHFIKFEAYDSLAQSVDRWLRFSLLETGFPLTLIF